MNFRYIKNSMLALVLLFIAAGCATVSLEDQERAASRIRVAEAHVKIGAYELAIRQYKAALEYNPRDPEIHFGLGEAYRQKGLLEEAEAELNIALKLDPEHQDVLLNLSVLYLQGKRYDEAIEVCNKLIDDPTFIRPSRALVNRSWAYYKSNEPDKARSDLGEALAIDPGNFHVRLNLGILLLESGDTLPAMRHLNKAIAILERNPQVASGPAESQVRFQMAQGHVKLGQRNKAVEQLRLAAKRGGAGEWAQKSREYLAVLE